MANEPKTFIFGEKVSIKSFDEVWEQQILEEQRKSSTPNKIRKPSYSELAYSFKCFLDKAQYQYPITKHFPKYYFERPYYPFRYVEDVFFYKKKNCKQHMHIFLKTNYREIHYIFRIYIYKSILNCRPIMEVFITKQLNTTWKNKLFISSEVLYSPTIEIRYEQ